MRYSRADARANPSPIPPPTSPLPAPQEADFDLAARVRGSLQHHLLVPNAVVAEADSGWITLSGSVKWQFQRNAARKVAAAVEGVRGVTDAITVRRDRVADDVKTALLEDAEVDEALVQVDVRGDGTVILTGAATSRAEREAAAWAAWRAPGVTHVVNHLVVNGQSMLRAPPGE
jgi:osmotically-inducible protein OsmY